MERTSQTLLFSADLHGNIGQYERLLDEALQRQVFAVVLGGDLTPKDPANRSIEKQRAFLTGFLFPRIRQFALASRKAKILTYLIFGNDDFAANHDLLEQHQGDAGYVVIHGKRARLTQDLDIVGYSFVPFTPFGYKDWEKCDLEDENEAVTRPNSRTEGVTSRSGQLRPVTFDLTDRRDTIERELRVLLSQSRRRTILVSHSPPHGTSLDLTHGTHVGSRGIRRVIEQAQPLITLHGHVHETVEASGSYIQTLGGTTCLAAGNSHLTPSPHVLYVDLADPQRTERVYLNNR